MDVKDTLIRYHKGSAITDDELITLWSLYKNVVDGLEVFGALYALVANDARRNQLSLESFAMARNLKLPD